MYAGFQVINASPFLTVKNIDQVMLPSVLWNSSISRKTDSPGMINYLVSFISVFYVGTSMMVAPGQHYFWEPHKITD